MSPSHCTHLFRGECIRLYNSTIQSTYSFFKENRRGKSLLQGYIKLKPNQSYTKKGKNWHWRETKSEGKKEATMEANLTHGSNHSLPAEYSAKLCAARGGFPFWTLWDSPPPRDPGPVQSIHCDELWLRTSLHMQRFNGHVWMRVLVLIWSKLTPKLTLFIQTHVLVWC
jgi:hypothetical protein